MIVFKYHFKWAGSWMQANLRLARATQFGRGDEAHLKTPQQVGTHYTKIVTDGVPDDSRG